MKPTEGEAEMGDERGRPVVTLELLDPTMPELVIPLLL